MVKFDREAIDNLTDLCAIKCSGEECDKLIVDLEKILGYIELLEEVDTENVEPMTRVVPITLTKRKDVVTDGEIPAKVMANAPMSEDGFFVVPKVVE